MPSDIADSWKEFEDDVIKDIAARIQANGQYTASAYWRQKRLAAIKGETDYINRRLAKQLNMSSRQLSQLMSDYASSAFEDDQGVLKEAYDDGQIEQYKANRETIDPILANGLKILNREINNVTRSIAGKYSQAFANALDMAHSYVLTGIYSTQEACNMVNDVLANQGIKGFVRLNGRNEQVTVVVERAIRTSVSKTILDAQFANLQDLGCDLVEVSSHIGARPEHALWQGKIYSISGKSKKYPPFRESTGYGTITGLGGINCRHSFYPYFEGISTKSHKRFDDVENEEVYQQRQAYKQALNLARKYDLRADIQSAGNQTLKAQNSRNLARKWRREANRISNTMNRVAQPYIGDEPSLFHYVGSISSYVKKLSPYFENLSADTRVAYFTDKNKHISRDHPDRNLDRILQYLPLAINSPDTILIDHKRSNTFNVLYMINDEEFLYTFVQLKSNHVDSVMKINSALIIDKSRMTSYLRSSRFTVLHISDKIKVPRG